MGMEQYGMKVEKVTGAPRKGFRTVAVFGEFSQENPHHRKYPVRSGLGLTQVPEYIMITHTSLYNKVYKKVWIGVMITFCWVFSYSMQLPTLFGVWGLSRNRGCGGRAVSLLISHQGVPGSIPGRDMPRFSHVGIVLGDAAGWRVFSGISRFPHRLILALLHSYLISFSSALKTSLLKAAQISQLNFGDITLLRVVTYGAMIIIHNMVNVSGAFDYDKDLGSCSIVPDKNKHSSKIALFIIGFVIPCVVIVGCYARIFWVVHKFSGSRSWVNDIQYGGHVTSQYGGSPNPKPVPDLLYQVYKMLMCHAHRFCCGRSEKRMREHATNVRNSVSEANSNQAKPKSKSREQRDLKAKRNEWRITKMVLAIFLSFVVCYLPITLVKVVDISVQYPGFHVLGYLLLYLSSCINPFIYVIMNKQYRQAYKTVLLWRPARLHSLTPAGTSSCGDLRGQCREEHTPGTCDLWARLLCIALVEYVFWSGQNQVLQGYYLPSLYLLKAGYRCVAPRRLPGRRGLRQNRRLHLIAA
ncbi:hypothetical protein PR048_000686 [Dryococelus australis]|uniref:G-protein coupled receptors family 1 profile domain-containing protein n=1 Tax=Dryococelus australis TaxID=614101 RepID=A0ABQ9IFA9_9NEOP|nr:hypothetical protein PR048_000686 [Dryococelus australis]